MPERPPHPPDPLPEPGCPKHMVYGPCGGVRPGGNCEVGSQPCPFVERPPTRYRGPTAPSAPGGDLERPLVLVDARPREATLAAAARIGRDHADWCDAVLIGEHHDNVDLPGSMIALAAHHEGARAWVTVACRDRNSVALEAELAACRAAEVDVVHCVTGDMRAPHVRPGTTPVFELDAVRLTRLATSLGLTVSVAESPLAEPAAHRPARAADKARAGATWCIVNLGVTPEQLQRFVHRTREEGADLRVVACVAAFTDEEGAARLGRLPGVGLDPDAVRRVLGAPRPVEAGIEHAVAEARAVLAVDGVSGVDLSGPASTRSEADRVAVMRAVAERLHAEHRELRVAPLDPAHRAEFGTMASWTADALASMDDVSVVAGACRGSASPSALAWLAECLGLAAGVALLDVGGGLGGPAEWAVEHYGVEALVVEPMAEACLGSRRLFGHRGLVATAAALPLRDASYPAAWMLGVLDTVSDPLAVLREVRRVLRADGRLGLLAYVACEAIEPDAAPSGNCFQTADELDDDLRTAGFAVIDRTDAAALPAAPVDWRVRQERLERALADAHGTDDRYHEAAQQSHRMAELLASGAVGAELRHLVCV